MNYTKECANFIDRSPTAFHAIETIREQLKEYGFIELQEGQRWHIEKGGKYFTTRNHTSLIAFSIGSLLQKLTFNLCASHSDTCTFKIKPESVLNKNGYVQLNTEGYGGMLCSTWMDRPLSIAGRVMVKQNNQLKEQLFDLKQPCCLIPNVAIHMNRKANEEMKFNKQIDMLPMVGLNQAQFDFKAFLAKHLDLDPKAISYVDGYLYNPEKCVIWGEKNEFLSGPRLDDLEMAFATLQGFLQAHNEEAVNVYCCFDNEEVGSRTRQGAASTYLNETLQRICLGLKKDSEEYYAALACSMMVSCDNAHAVHPNHPEKADELNRPKLNQGIVIKFNAAQSYTSDAFSAAYFEEICQAEKLSTQTFTNRSDIAGGGTLGNISTSQVSIASVDIGLAQLAMHSTFETAGAFDIECCVKALRAFFNRTIVMLDSGTFKMS